MIVPINRAMVLLIVVLVIITTVSSTIITNSKSNSNSVQDLPYLQEIAHRSIYANNKPIADWPVLPLDTISSEKILLLTITTANNGNSDGSDIKDNSYNSHNSYNSVKTREILISENDHNYYCSQRQQLTMTDKIQRVRPYSNWEKFYSSDSAATQLLLTHHNSNQFYAISNNNIVIVTITINDSPDGSSYRKDHTNSPLGYSYSYSNCAEIESTENMFSTNTEWGTVISAESSANYVWLSTDKYDLLEVSVSTRSWRTIDLTTNSNYPFDGQVSKMLYVNAWNKLFVGSNTTLFTITYNTIISTVTDTVTESNTLTIEHEWIGGVIDTTPLDLSYDAATNTLWLAEQDSVHRMSADGQWYRFGYHQGSPMGNVTTVEAINGVVWVGFRHGLARLSASADPTQIDGDNYYQATFSIAGEGGVTTLTTTELPGDPWMWLYYSGNRYLPDDSVMGIVPATNREDESTVLVLTNTGTSLMECVPWNLQEKALAMETFQYPRHFRRGLTNGVSLASYGVLDSYVKGVSDNDGLWTSMHGLGLIYRYMTMKSSKQDNPKDSELVRRQAWRAFEALEMLSNVTGAYPHFPARSYCYVADNTAGCSTEDGSDRWHESTVMPGWLWKDDTSSDEIDGHLSFLPMAYDQIAITAEEKDRVRKLLFGITDGILANDLYLIDPTTNKPTTWGFWNPSLVNDDPKHYSERPANSVGILAYLATAYSISGDTKYKDKYYELGNNYNYFKNALNAKIDNPEDDNHSDNELIFLTYHTLFYASKRLTLLKREKIEVTGNKYLREESTSIILKDTNDQLQKDLEEMVKPLLPSIDRYWLLVKGERSPLWFGIYAGIAERPVTKTDLYGAVWSLRHWAIDLITWPINNLYRWDVNVQPFFGRDNTNQLMKEIRPPQERVTGHWNGDPFALEGGSGTSEQEPAIWELPYYLMRFYGLISD